ncbi:MAG: response regulator [Deltaproteobacteria bacterium]|nr:response regulator [Deltaproteobacteria bacterium]
MDAHIEERYRSETRRLVARRGAFGAMLFAAGVGMGGVLEVHYHPERLRYLLLVFTLELAICLVANACHRSRALRRLGIGLTCAACVALVACVTLYGALTGANRAALALLFIAFELTTALLFPWGAGNQGLMAIACMLAQTSLVLGGSRSEGTLPVAYGLYAVAASGLLSIIGAAFLDRQRRTVFGQREQLDRHLATFRDLTRTLHGFDSQRVLSVVCTTTLETFRLRRLWVVWQTLGGGSVQGYLVRAAGGSITWEPLVETRQLWHWMAGWRHAAGAFLTSSAAADVPSALYGANTTTLLCMPLGDNGERLGAICADRGRAALPLTERELALASVLASGAAIAMANAWLYDQVAAASAEKSVFLARIAHELRNPLQAILWDVDALREGADGERMQLERVRQNSLMTLDLAKELQDFAEIETRRLTANPETINLTQTLDHLEVTARALLDGRPIAFRTDVAPAAAVVVTDPFRLRQILTNLISNAAKFTASGAIEVEASRLGTEIAISARDTGVGIDATDLTRIFAPFYRGSARALTGARGIGLGLAISQELAVILGGRLEVESVAGGGSTFRLLLPAHSDVPALAGSAEESAALRGAVVLLIEDDPSYRTAAASVLRQHGANVIEASDGFEGLRRARESRPDVIVLDLGLPGMDGLHVLTHLKRDRQLSGVPVVIATADGDLETRCREAGCAAWLSKPYTPMELIPVLAPLVRGASCRPAHARPI